MVRGVQHGDNGGQGKITGFGGYRIMPEKKPCSREGEKLPHSRERDL